jgi:hypothetical protein
MAALATGVQDGRPRVETAVMLAGTDATGAPTSSSAGTVRFLLAGPADVVGLAAGVITKRYPTPGTIDHESDHCPHIEFIDPELPWRYTPAARPAAGVGNQHPWLVLIAGVADTELTIAGDQVSLTPEVQLAHKLGTPGGAYPWAHLQVDAAGRQVARVLCGRNPLLPGTDYVAVLVPAFDSAGKPRWTGAGPVTVPMYDQWKFRTATPAGSFEDLAALLKPGAADPETGRAPLDYPRVPLPEDLKVRGALAPIDAIDTALPTSVRDDLAALRTPARDERNRPIVGLPRYGEAWRTDAPVETTWGATMNTDPRDRGVAGLGLELGIRLQEELAAEAKAHLGALAEARQRIRDLVLGLTVSHSLWAKRTPTDSLDRLWLLGPGLRRVVTPNGTVAALATAPDRPLPEGIFSSAVRRILRSGPARTALTAAGRAQPREILEAANRCPPRPVPSDDGVPLTDLGINLHEFERRRRNVLAAGQFDINGLIDGLRQFYPDFRGEFSHQDLVKLLEDLGEPVADEPPCRPVDLEALATGVTAAFDPTRIDGAARVRVLATIDGYDPTQALAPPEVCVGLDRPVWADVKDAFAEWLLPGVGAIPADSVIAVETNPRFVDSLLTGLNTQLLSELRWRNIPIATGCTPLRVFWDRAHTTSGDRIDDIVGIRNWSDGSDIGAAQHRPAGASGRDLVIVIRGQLFLRYPSTVVYLITATHGGTVDWTTDPAAGAVRVLPSFQGRIASDVTFFGFQGFNPDDIVDHWLVFEEPPAGYRFSNDVSTDPQPQKWAAASFALPVRVLIRGDSLDPDGPP